LRKNTERKLGKNKREHSKLVKTREGEEKNKVEQSENMFSLSSI